MTDLRDHLADFEAAAQRLLAAPPVRPKLTLVHARPARCHPDRPVLARGLCRNCYGFLWRTDQLEDLRAVRRRADFVADYEMLRDQGYTRRQIAQRLGMTYDGCSAAYRRAVRAGELTPDRRPA